MSGQRIHDIKILSATASYLPEVGKIECIVKGAVLDIENNFLDLEGLKVFVGDKQVAEDATDTKGNFKTTLYFDFDPAVDALDMYLEHIPTEIQSSRKYIPIADLPKKKEQKPTPPKSSHQTSPQKENPKPVIESKPKQINPIQTTHTSPISKGAAITAVRSNGLMLGDIKYAHLVDDKAVVMEAVKQNGLALEFASARLKKDIEIFNIAVEQNEDAALFADEKLYLYYMDILGRLSVGMNNNITDYFNYSSFFSIKKLVLLGLGNGHDIFGYICDKLKDDKDIAYAAVKLNAQNFFNLSSRLQKDRNVALSAIKSDAGNGNNLLNHYKFRELGRLDDEQLVSSLGDIYSVFNFMGHKLARNKSFILKYTKQLQNLEGNSRILHYIQCDILLDVDILPLIMKYLTIGPVHTSTCLMLPRYSNLDSHKVSLYPLDHRFKEFLQKYPHIKRQLLDTLPNIKSYI